MTSPTLDLVQDFETSVRSAVGVFHLCHDNRKKFLKKVEITLY